MLSATGPHRMEGGSETAAVAAGTQRILTVGNRCKDVAESRGRPG
jgi:hypothetical protein